MDAPLLLTVHAVAVSALAGLAWVVQLVVYPAFLLVGPTPAWRAFHDAHSRAMALAVVLPWAAQGVTLGLLLLARPAGVPLALVLVASALGLVTVGRHRRRVGAAARPAGDVRRGAGPPAAAHARPAHGGLDGRRAVRRGDAARRRDLACPGDDRAAPCPTATRPPPARPGRAAARARRGRPVPLARGRRLRARPPAWRAAQDELCAEHLAALPGRDRLRDLLEQLLARRLGRRARLARRAAVLDPARARAGARRPVDPRRRRHRPRARRPGARSTRPAPPRSTPGRRARRAGCSPCRCPAAATRSRCCACSTSRPASRSTGRSTAAATPPSPGSPAASAFFYVRRLPPDAVPAGEEQFHRRVLPARRRRRRAERGRPGVGRGPGPDQLLRLLGVAGRPLADGRARAPGPRRATTCGCSTWPRATPPVEVQVGVDARCAAWVARDGRLRRAHRPGRAARPALHRRPRPRRRRGPTSCPRTARPCSRTSRSSTTAGWCVLRSRHAVSEVVVRDADGASPWRCPASGRSPACPATRRAATRCGSAGPTRPPRRGSTASTARTGALDLWEDAPGRVDLPAVVARVEVVRPRATAPPCARSSSRRRTGRTGRARPCSTATAGSASPLTPAYTAQRARLGRGRRRLGRRQPARRRRRRASSGTATGCASTSRTCSTTSPPSPRTSSTRAGRRGEQLGDLRRQQRRPARRRRAHPGPGRVRRRRLQRPAARHGPVRAVRAGAHLERRVRHGRRPDRARLAAVVLAVPPRASRGRRTRRCCSPSSTATAGWTRCTRASCARRCSTPRSSDRPVLLRDERDVGHGARSVSRTVGLSVDVLAFLAAHTGLDLEPRPPLIAPPWRPHPVCRHSGGLITAEPRSGRRGRAGRTRLPAWP